MIPSMVRAQARYQATPRGKYTMAKAQAGKRGVPFLLTFDEWFGIWTRSKRWNMRGCRPGKYVMCRRGDIGPYAVHNVFIARFERNLRDARRVRHTARYTEVTYGD